MLDVYLKLSGGALHSSRAGFKGRFSVNILSLDVLRADLYGTGASLRRTVSPSTLSVCCDVPKDHLKVLGGDSCGSRAGPKGRLRGLLKELGHEACNLGVLFFCLLTFLVQLLTACTQLG